MKLFETVYKLHCSMCDETFAPVVATERGEMLSPDFSVPESHAIPWRDYEELLDFHRKHKGHKLMEIELPKEHFGYP